MSLLSEIREAAVDPKTDILVVLRKCRILASRLGNAEFRDWVDKELDGYNSKAELPEYRVIKVQSQGFFDKGYGAQINNAPIPLACVPKDFRESVANCYFMQSISAYQSLVGSANEDLRVYWPADLVRLVAANIYAHAVCLQAWQLIPRTAVIALIETVRNRTLKFVSEIEVTAPDAGELNPSKTIPAERIQQVFHTYITGNVGNFAAGGQNVTQVAFTDVRCGDIEGLKTVLLANGIEPPDLNELEQALKSDPAKPTGAFGKKVSAWMGKMLSKAAEGTWRIATTTAANLLTKALSSYYGFPH